MISGQTSDGVQFGSLDLSGHPGYLSGNDAILENDPGREDTTKEM